MILSIIFGTIALGLAAFGGFMAGRAWQNSKWWFACAEAGRDAYRHDIEIQAGMLHALQIASREATGEVPPSLAPIHAQAIERSVLSTRALLAHRFERTES